MSLANMQKALKCANNDDSCMIKYDDNETDNITFTFTDPKSFKTQDVTVKLMDIDSEHLGIPDQEYSVVCEMPSGEFQKTCKDLAMFSDSINITATKVDLVLQDNTFTFRPELLSLERVNLDLLLFSSIITAVLMTTMM